MDMMSKNNKFILFLIFLILYMLYPEKVKGIIKRFLNIEDEPPKEEIKQVAKK
jgi:hypothetical protein